MTTGGARRLLHTKERSKYGVTLTIRERTTGEERVLVGEGGVMAALKECIAKIDALEGDWYVQCLSSPETIYTDLSGVRRLPGKSLMTPEASLLGRAGRLDLLRERPLWAKSDGRRRIAAGGT